MADDLSNVKIIIEINGQEVKADIESIKVAFKGVDTEIEKAKKSAAGLDDEVKKTGKDSKKVKDEVNLLAKEIDKTLGSSRKLSSSWGRFAVVANQSLELIRKIQWLSRGISAPFEASGQFEQYRTVLKNLLGDQEEANARFKEMVDFAAKTPFNVPGIVEAGNQLQALGRYSLDLIRDLGDLAAASGRDVQLAVNAYTNLVTGRTGMAIKQFRMMLISTDDWVRQTGKQVLKTGAGVKASVSEMLDALPKLIREKNFAGLMDQQSKTLMGRISNLQDIWQQLMASIGDEFLEKAKSTVTWLSDEIIPAIKDNLFVIKNAFNDLAIFIAGVFVVKIAGGITKTISVIRLLYATSLPALSASIVKNTQAIENGSKSVGHFRLGLEKLVYFIRTNPIVALATAIGAITLAVLEYNKIMRKSAEEVYNDAMAEEKMNKERIDAKLNARDQAQSNYELLKSYEDLKNKGTSRTADENERYKATVQAIARAYPDAVDGTGQFSDALLDSQSKINSTKEAIQSLTGELIKLNQEQQKYVKNSAIAQGEMIKQQLKESAGSLYLETQPGVVKLTAPIQNFIDDLVDRERLIITKGVKEFNVEDLIKVIEGIKTPEEIDKVITKYNEWEEKVKSQFKEVGGEKLLDFKNKFDDLLKNKKVQIDIDLNPDKERLLEKVRGNVEIIKEQYKDNLPKQIAEVNKLIDEFGRYTDSATVKYKKFEEGVDKKTGASIFEKVQKQEDILLRRKTGIGDKGITDQERAGVMTLLSNELRVLEQVQTDADRISKSMETEAEKNRKKALAELKSDWEKLTKEFKEESDKVSSSTELSSEDKIIKSKELYKKYYADIITFSKKFQTEYLDIFYGKGATAQRGDEQNLFYQIYKENKTIRENELKDWQGYVDEVNKILEFKINTSGFSDHVAELGLQQLERLYSIFKSEMKNKPEDLWLPEEFEFQNKMIQMIKDAKAKVYQRKILQFTVDFKFDVKDSDKALFKGMDALRDAGKNLPIEYFKQLQERIEADINATYDFKKALLSFEYPTTYGPEGEIINAKRQIAETENEIKRLQSLATVYKQTVEELRKPMQGEGSTVKSISLSGGKKQTGLEKLGAESKGLSKLQSEESQFIPGVTEEEKAAMTEREQMLQNYLLLLEQVYGQISDLTHENDINEIEVERQKWESKLDIANEFADQVSSIFAGLYQMSAESARNEVDAWLEAYNDTLDIQEKQSQNYARTTAQQESIKEKYDKKRQDADDKASELYKKKAKTAFDLNKAASIAQATINIAQGITAAWKNPTLAPFLIPLIVAAGAVQIALIAKQEFPGYSEGGYTGSGSKNEPAGIVHKGEYVMDAETTQKYRPLFEYLSKERKRSGRKYATGGYVNSTLYDLLGFKSLSLGNVVDVNRDYYLRSVSREGNNKDLVQAVTSMHETLSYYLKNPVPSAAYLDNNQARMVASRGISGIRKRKLRN